jgi:hypothetical protein
MECKMHEDIIKHLLSIHALVKARWAIIDLDKQSVSSS